MREVLPTAARSSHRSELSAVRDERALILSNLAELEARAGFKLIPTPAEDPNIPLVCLAPPNRIVCQFNKVELARILGHDTSKCWRCKPQIVLVQ